MTLNCAVLHSDPGISAKLLSYIDKVPLLTLCGSYSDPLRALREYYVTKVELYFVGIYPVEEDGIGGMDFCRLLSPATKVVFIAASGRYASDCFRLDALDYLPDDVTLPMFFQSVNKAVRWFSLLQHGTLPAPGIPEGDGEDAGHLYLKVENCIVRLPLDSIDYIESFGDYIKVHSNAGAKPLLSLCSMKYVERKLPGDKFVRIHRSYIVRMAGVSAIGRDALSIGRYELPIGEAYRERVKAYLAGMVILYGGCTDVFFIQKNGDSTVLAGFWSIFFAVCLPSPYLCNHSIADVVLFFCYMWKKQKSLNLHIGSQEACRR